MSEFVEQVQGFVQQSLLGNEKAFDTLPNHPLLETRLFQQRGLANWWLPASVGGRGLPLEESVDVAAELAYADAGVAFTLFLSIIGTSTVDIFGTPEQKERFLRPLVGSGGLTATLGSERDAGSELVRTRTRAERSGGGWVLNGRKYFSTNTEHADWVMVITSCDDRPDGFAALIVPQGTPGMNLVKRWDVNGVRGSATYEVQFEGCRVPDENMLDINGIRALEVGLNPSRILIGATGVGIGRRIRDLCLAYAKDKPLKGATLLENAVFAAKLGQMEMELETMLAVCKAAARDYDAKKSGPDAALTFKRAGALKSSVVAKMSAGQAGWRIASVGSEMFGGLGYTNESLIGKLVRDMRYISLIEGGDDALRDFLFGRFVLPLVP